MNSKLELAEIVMLEAHKGQYRNDKITPYSVHPINVVRILKKLVQDEEILIAGYLHDVLEDTDYPPSKILDRFGQRVLDLVNELTFEKNSDKELYWKQVNALSKDAKIIKMADILHNLSDKGKKTENFVHKRIHALEIIIIDLQIAKLPKGVN